MFLFVLVMILANMTVALATLVFTPVVSSYWIHDYTELWSALVTALFFSTVINASLLAYLGLFRKDAKDDKAK